MSGSLAVSTKAITPITCNKPEAAAPFQDLDLSSLRLTKSKFGLSSSLTLAMLLGEYTKKIDHKPVKNKTNVAIDFTKYCSTSKAFYSGLGSCLIVAVASRSVATIFIGLTVASCYIGFHKERSAQNSSTKPQNTTNNLVNKIKQAVFSPALVQFVCAGQFLISTVISLTQGKALFPLSNFLTALGLISLGNYINNSVAHKVNQTKDPAENKLVNIKWYKNPVLYFTTGNILLTFNNLLLSDVLTGNFSSIMNPKVIFFGVILAGAATAIYHGLIKKSLGAPSTTENFKNSYISHFLLNTTQGIANIAGGHILVGLGILFYAFNNLQVVREQNRELIGLRK